MATHMDTISKRIGTREYTILKILRNTDIIPQIVKLEPNRVVMIKYQMTLAQYIEEQNLTHLSQLGGIFDKIKELIEYLHKKNVFHGDLHTHNIVLNMEPIDVRIIDFGESMLLSKISEENISYYNNFLEIDPPVTTVDQLIQYECKNWTHDYFYE
jgi:tRNA A-37 threonylcarbamoyl transferase component Bud32